MEERWMGRKKERRKERREERRKKGGRNGIKEDGIVERRKG